VTFDIVLLTKWKVLEVEFKLSIKVLHHLELYSLCSTFHSLVMDYMITECPEAMRDCQEMGYNTSSPGGSCAARGDTSQMIVLKA